MRYMIKLKGCPEVDGKFKADVFDNLNKVEELHKETNMIPDYKSNELVITECSCNGNMHTSFPKDKSQVEATFDVSFHSDNKIKGCQLIISNAYNLEKDDMKYIAKYFGVKRKDIVELKDEMDELLDEIR